MKSGEGTIFMSTVRWVFRFSLVGAESMIFLIFASSFFHFLHVRRFLFFSCVIACCASYLKALLWTMSNYYFEIISSKISIAHFIYPT